MSKPVSNIPSQSRCDNPPISESLVQLGGLRQSLVVVPEAVRAIAAKVAA
jgi:hypothetical protein